MRIVLQALVLPLLLVGLSATAVAQSNPKTTQQCPVVCEVDPIKYWGGTDPAGTLILDFTWSTSGIGDNLCHTCIPCRGQVIFQWTPGPDEGASYSRDGGQSWGNLNGPIGPLTLMMTSYCADPAPDTIDVLVWGPNGNYDVHLVLMCYCDGI
jgi:hypothetical protein